MDYMTSECQMDYMTSECQGANVKITCCKISLHRRGGGLGSRPKKMYGERLGDGVEYH